MPRLRKDQAAVSSKDRLTILAPVDIIEALNRMADAKGISRNALICQMLSKATKAKAKKGAE